MAGVNILKNLVAGIEQQMDIRSPNSLLQRKCFIRGQRAIISAIT